ncbi:uncharacterized protein [Elaeis guineensis]|uniref:uncharacterized protein isoform X2 n=1 Tax=Elaeis guineensis var. tenera TaxID=51953 RepID=UPI003C6D7156
MSEASERARREFPAFPFDPYPIQTDFMAFLYDSLEKGGIAMLESPTGTGKTLSIICSAMQWAVDRRKKQREQQNGKSSDTKSSSIDEEEEPDWMRDFAIPGPEMEEVGRRRLGSGSGALEKKASFVRPKNVEKTAEESPENDEEMEFLVDDYESEAEDMEYGIGRSKRKGWRCLSSSGSDEEEVGGGMEEEVTPKVYFTSRTHSQLSQFVREFKRTAFASELNLVCLGSRKNLCINSDVLKLGNLNRINEHCLELQKSKKDSKIKTDNGRVRRVKASSGCPMLGKQNLRKQFRNKVWEHGALDIEDLAQLGRKIGTCPYYGARDMVRAGDLVVLPYQSLLLRSARESLGLNLKNSVVVIDEAHNVADSLTSMYNSKITTSQLKQVLSHLELYLGRFRNLLGAGNRRYIQTLIVLIRSFLRLLLGCQEDSSGISNITNVHADQATEEKNFGDTSMTINEFLFSLNIDNINLVKLHRYVKESNIIHKVTGYGTKFASSESGSLHSDCQGHGAEGSVISGFQALVDIFLSLINNDSDGRIIVSRQKLSGQTEEGCLKFVMLCGEKIFSEIAGQAHAVVLAGGTLQPIEETRMRLFPGLALDQVHFFTCNHIVPPENILPIAVSRGPSGMTFDFSYNSRNTPSMIDELGRLLCNLVAVIPEGVVVFFSSFDYEGQVYDTWRATGLLSKILKKKRVYREPRNSIDVDLVLKEYKEAIESPSGVLNDSRTNGALLLAVVGGKISEGINFSDGMGRCVIMVGLPYPSPADIELMERVKYIEGLGELSSPTPNKSFGNKLYSNSKVQSGFDILRKCKQRGREYYDNLCMKAVNQSIGRAIRHINDYAAILLVDSRYACDSSIRSFSDPTNKLPLWIKDRLVSATQSYGEVHRLLHQFFQFNKKKYNQKY